MRCTQEQFESIKDRITFPTRDFRFDLSFYPYLTNYYSGNIDFLGTIAPGMFREKVEIHETFNADIFLEACGVEVEKVWSGDELEIDFGWGWVEGCSANKYRLKPQPSYDKEIEALQQKAKENGMIVTINFEKL